jgi:hypothetical protein
MSADPYRATTESVNSPKDPGSWNRYTYAINDPIGLTDPEGLEGIPASGCLVNGFWFPFCPELHRSPQVSLDPQPPRIDKRTNDTAHKLLRARLSNLGDCYEVLKAGGIDIDKIIQGQSSIKFYDARPESDYYGVTINYVAPQIKSDNILGNVVSSGATTITGTRVVLLGLDFFGGDMSKLTVPEMVLFQWDQENTLFHEAIHAVNGVGDAAMLTNSVFLANGLSNAAWKATDGRNTGEITDWLAAGCKK